MSARALLVATGLLILTGGHAAIADTLVATRTLRAETILGPADLKLRDGDTPGALSHPAKAVGLEARRNLYAGQPIRAVDLGPPAIILRNDIVVLSYFRGGLAIETEGRALDRAGVGDRVRVMNMTSRASVSGVVLSDGTVEVTGLRAR